MTQRLADAFATGIAAHPQTGTCCSSCGWTTWRDPRRAAVKVGLVCPYAWDVPGGVQAHVRDLAGRLLLLGHAVSVLAPVDAPDAGPAATGSSPPAGRCPCRTTARSPGSRSARCRWRAPSAGCGPGAFDVLHVHEPTVPSLSMLACFAAQGPVVATFHTSTTRSRALQLLGTALQPGLEKVTGRIAVSAAARRVLVEHLGGDAVLVPNGVEVARFAGAEPLALRDRRPTVVFLGRLDEPRKGLAVLLASLPRLLQRVPDLRVLVAGPGEAPEGLPACVELLGRVSEDDKPRLYATGDVYCAPNAFGESFGIVLAEAMAAGTPVVASDLEALPRRARRGRAGAWSRSATMPPSPTLWPPCCRPRPPRPARGRGPARRAAYDWGTVARAVVEVYETVPPPLRSPRTRRLGAAARPAAGPVDAVQTRAGPRA